MPFQRPTLSTLRNQVAQDISSALPGSDALLRFSNLKITGEAQAALAHGHYGYLDWIALQSNPFTATDEYLEAWAALVSVFRLAATSASGSITFTGVNGTVLPAGSAISRGDGIGYTTTSSGTVSGGSVNVTATANADSTGLTGAFGNAAIGVSMTLASSIAGIQSSGSVSVAFVGGADLEIDSALRARMLQVYQNKPQGGSKADYVTWATQVPGVTRAWCSPNSYGAGTVVVYAMLDGSESAYNGFPQGANGVSANDARGVAAVGDQLIIANYIYLLQPVTALVYVVAPTANPINFSIQGIPAASRVAAQAAIASVFLSDGAPGGTIILAHIWSAISAVTGVNDFVIISPAVDITNPTGSLPVVGTITWS